MKYESENRIKNKDNEKIIMTPTNKKSDIVNDKKSENNSGNKDEKKSFFSDIKKGFTQISRNSNSKYSDEKSGTKNSNKRNSGNTTIFVKFNISQFMENILTDKNR